ncbi:MAG TPA: hypothetical protein VFI90_02920 [Rubrobacter sp.]|nr:hypothetical protein [Rubrobacter sp.]
MKMVKVKLSGVLRAVRKTALVLGLAMTLALVLGITSTALAAVPGDPFHLGKVNAINALTSLVGSVNNAMLKVDNNSTGTSATALDLQVEPGKAPMKVNSQTKVANLNADRLDGKDSGEFLGANQKALDAAHADQATNATNATNAQNADKLDGKDSTQFGPPDIFATVLADGTLWGPASTSQAASASRTSTGVYDVRFNQSVDQVGCVHFAQSLDTVAFTQTIAGPRYGGPPSEVRVRQFDHAGNPVNGAVSLVVFCK